MSELKSVYIDRTGDWCRSENNTGKFYIKSEADKVIAEKESETRKQKRALWLVRAERYKIKEFIAREEGNLSNQMSWSRILRERTYNQWVDQLLRIANLANKLQNKCLAKAEEFGG